MIIYNGKAMLDDVVTYRCDRCGKEAGYLSDSWSQITPITVDGAGALIHHCLECRSDKQEWAPFEHPAHPDQLTAKVMGACWHSPTADRWPCGLKP